ncbi:GNAT family N-acetyltransferase [Vibrio rhodolitus]|uniref:GNAT family N-acetyltransferase n=1 Tax=Vibrio rhodolitus TaxID=2231649 RepID=UPI000E0B02A3|nr:GNAT family N-acetyltransferase [Vibrio rhodolitus]
MEIKHIPLESALPIRHAVLWPSKPPTFCQVDGDETALHYGAFVDDKLVSVASIYLTGNKARLRKFATLPDYQGQGIGTQMIEHILSQLALTEIEYFWCDARASALGFYRKFGLMQEGEEFYKSEIAYYKVSLHIPPKPLKPKG